MDNNTKPERDRLRFMIILVVVLLIQSCASRPPVQPYLYKPTENDGTIVIFRPWALPGGGVYIGVKLDGRRILSLGTNEYAAVRLRAGLHEIDAGGKLTSISVRERDNLYLQVEVVRFAPYFVEFGIKETSEDAYKAIANELKEQSVQYTQ